MLIPAHALHAVQDMMKAVSNEGHFTSEAETLLVLITLTITVG
jgi:hypothetical protein